MVVRDGLCNLIPQLIGQLLKYFNKLIWLVLSGMATHHLRDYSVRHLIQLSFRFIADPFALIKLIGRHDGLIVPARWSEQSVPSKTTLHYVTKPRCSKKLNRYTAIVLM